MVDDDWLTNDHIGENQHATLFWELLKQSNPAGFWAVRGDRVPSFLKLLVQHGWPALLAFALLVVLWIRRASLRSSE